MFYKNAIVHTAALIKAVSVCTTLPLSDITIAIGEKKIERLLHNSPMNQLLDFSRVVMEIIYDTDLVYRPSVVKAQPDVAFGNHIASIVVARTKDHHRYGSVLYDVLTGNG